MHENITNSIQNQEDKIKTKKQVYKTKMKKQVYNMIQEPTSQLRRKSKHQALPANEQRWLDPKVW